MRTDGRRRAVWAGLLLIALVLLPLALPWLLPRAEAPEIANPLSRPLPEPNGWELAAEAAWRLPAMSDMLDAAAREAGYPSAAAGEVPGMAAYLRAAEPPMEALDAALAVDEWRWPIDFSSPDSVYHAPYRDMDPSRRLAHARIQRAYLRRRTGDVAGAVDDVLAVVRLGRRLESARAALPLHLGGQMLTRLGLTHLRRLLGAPLASLDPATHDPTVDGPAPRLTPAERAAFEGALERLSALAPDGEHAAEALAVEYHTYRVMRQNPEGLGVELHIVDSSDGRYLPPATLARLLLHAPNRFLDRGTLQREHAAMTLRAMALVRRPGLRPELRRAARTGEIVPLSEPRFAHNLYGCLALQSRHEEAEELLSGHLQGEAEHALTLAALALRLYADDHGRLPKTLQPLVDGGYLDALPLDPFTGEPLKYRPREGKVYSVGDDGRDDGGEDARMADQVEPLFFVAGLMWRR